MEQMGWHFPLTNGGTGHGFNDPGMAHFGGSPLGSLARETIQNSLDAKQGSAHNVEVVFDVVGVDGGQLGHKQLVDHLSACLPAAESENNPRATKELKRALDLLAKKEITFLRVADYHTLGLDEARWKALVKSQGSSHKEDRIAGGSHGIGKYAPFVCSQLRTVFYWSQSSTTKACQGKAVLMSHDGHGGRTQGTGYFGKVEGCESLREPDIPPGINDLESKRKAPGTSLWIAGFADHRGWQSRVARSVVESYFCAIAEGQLEVLIEPESGESMFPHWHIGRETLPDTFDGLLKTAGDDDDGEPLREAYAFYRALQDSESIVKECQSPELGYCRLLIRVDEDLPSKVGLIRKTGMLITAKQNKLLRFPGLQDFAAVLRFESEQGNELLRDMENPAHDQFEPERLDEGRRRQGRRALNRVVDWVRRELREVAAPPTTGTAEVVSELAHLLPDIEPDESFGDGSGVEHGFGTSDLISLRPARRAPNAPLPDESADDAGDDALLQEGSGGSRASNGGTTSDPDAPKRNSGDNDDGADGAGATGGGRARHAVTFRDFRLLPSEGDGIRIAFTPTENAKAVRVDLAEAGDSNAVQRADLHVVTPRGPKSLSCHTLDFVASQRIVLEINGDGPLDHRAWQLQTVLGGDAEAEKR